MNDYSKRLLRSMYMIIEERPLLTDTDKMGMRRCRGYARECQGGRMIYDLYPDGLISLIKLA